MLHPLMRGTMALMLAALLTAPAWAQSRNVQSSPTTRYDRTAAGEFDSGNADQLMARSRPSAMARTQPRVIQAPSLSERPSETARRVAVSHEPVPVEHEPRAVSRTPHPQASPAVVHSYSVPRTQPRPTAVAVVRNPTIYPNNPTVYPSQTAAYTQYGSAAYADSSLALRVAHRRPARSSVTLHTGYSRVATSYGHSYYVVPGGTFTHITYGYHHPYRASFRHRPWGYYHCPPVIYRSYPRYHYHYPRHSGLSIGVRIRF